MSNLKYSLAACLGVLCFGLAVANLSIWLKHESSPIARGSATAALRPCVDSFCTAEIEQHAIRCLGPHTDPTCGDLAAFWAAIFVRNSLPARLNAAPNNQLVLGERLARKRNCFRCHGELGQGGVANRGSLKGYIPGYFGRDFDYLTDGGRPSLVREWIVTGAPSDITEHPITGPFASYLLNHQSTSMPEFSSLPACEIELLTEYVLALHEFGPLDIAGVKRYIVQSTTVKGGPHQRNGCGPDDADKNESQRVAPLRFSNAITSEEAAG